MTTSLPLPQPTRTLLGSLAAIALGLGLFFTASTESHAKDLSLPYRNHPGFACHHWNNRGECTDFSFVESKYYRPAVARPATPATAYYRSSTRSSTRCAYRCNEYFYEDDFEDDFDDGDVTIRVSADDDEVEPGDTIRFRITVRNEESFTRRVDVRALFDEDLAEFGRASNGGRERDDGEVEWTLSLGGRASRTLTLDLEVDDRADDGDELTLTVESGNEEDEIDVEIDDDNRNDDDDCDNDDNCDVTVNLTANDDEAEPGELVTFTIVLENDTDRDRFVDVRALFEEDEWRFFSASDGGTLGGNDNRINWNDIRVEEDDRRVLHFSMRVDSRADDGDRLKMEIETGDDSDELTIEVQD